MKVSPDIKLDYKDIAIVPNRTTLSSRSEVILERELKFYHSPRVWTGLPIICSNMSSIAGLEMAGAMAEHKAITCLHKYIDLEEVQSWLDYTRVYHYVWPTIGMKDDELLELRKWFSPYSQINICIDIANGHIDKFVSFCQKVRNTYPEAIIMAGNVSIPECVQELIIHGGVDICKVGIGPGANCTTYNMTGIKSSMASVSSECSSSAHGLKSEDKRIGLICADGGCKEVGDICKSFCLGSDFVMLGGMLAGYDENCGEWEYERDFSTTKTVEVALTKDQYENKDFLHKILCGRNGNVKDNGDTITGNRFEYTVQIPVYSEQKKNLIHYGMSSHHAQEKHGEGRKEYRASEGKLTKIPYKGSVHEILKEIKGGLRSCATYLGANTLKDMSKCARFNRIIS